LIIIKYDDIFCFLYLRASLLPSKEVYNDFDPMKKLNISVIGVGYVGFVSGVCLASIGHNVICVDSNIEKINSIASGNIPFYEDGLVELFQANSTNIKLSNDISIIRDSDVIMIAVGTPELDDGSTDMSYINGACDQISNVLLNDRSYVIVIKSTVPVGTNDDIDARFKLTNLDCEVISNPEFLREGCAIKDFMNPDRIVLGADSDNLNAIHIMRTMYASFIDRNVKFLITDRKSSEMIKYLSNSYLAMRVAFANEVATLSDTLGCNTLDVLDGIGSDSRIGKNYFSPGIGFGGSCFPKDVNSVVHTIVAKNLRLPMIQSIMRSNKDRISYMVTKIVQMCDNDIQNKTIGCLGVSFKPNTDDIRESPAIDIITKLISYGAKVAVFDPKALDNMKKHIGDCNGSIIYCDSPDHVVSISTASFVLVRWDAFSRIDGTITL